MPHLPLRIHNIIAHQFYLAVMGVESTVLQGRKGLGKTTALKMCSERFEAAELTRELDAPGGEPARRVLYFEASTAVGRKTALIDLYTTVVGRGGTRLRQTFTPKDLIEAIADELCTQNYRVLIVDEAQKIDAPNHDQLRQILDATRSRNHLLGVFLVGTAPLRDLIVANGELGQRYAGYIEMEGVTASDLSTHFEALHPDLPALRQQHGPAAWQQLLNELLSATGGSVRRLESVLGNANALAIRSGAAMTLGQLEKAMAKLAPEL
jgi:DNA transposition AAA+ family ATPase